MASASDEKKAPVQPSQVVAPQAQPEPTEVDDEKLASVVGGVLRRGGDDDLDDLEVEQ